MRSIASMRMQESVHALISVREYGRMLEDAVREVLGIAADEPRSGLGAELSDTQRSKAVAASSDKKVTGSAPETREAKRGHRAVVLFTSEHGFVGAFNERLLDAASKGLEHSDTLLILGSRGAALALERGLPVVWTEPMATRLASIPELVRAVQERLYPLIARGEATRAEAIFGCSERGEAARVVRCVLFPLELRPFGGQLLETGSESIAASAKNSHTRAFPPLHNLPAAELLERLTAEYLLARLTEAATESLASENGARFVAMQSARDHIDRKLRELELAASRARQEEVTTELIDLVTGTLALG
jgi:F-type H+-transporting ATPase subunit gamma